VQANPVLCGRLSVENQFLFSGFAVSICRVRLGDMKVVVGSLLTKKNDKKKSTTFTLSYPQWNQLTVDNSNWQLTAVTDDGLKPLDHSHFVNRHCQLSTYQEVLLKEILQAIPDRVHHHPAPSASGHRLTFPHIPQVRGARLQPGSVREFDGSAHREPGLAPGSWRMRKLA
jgi:hypothetical protein